MGRIVGPGRIERGYLQRIEELQRTVETAELLERGSARLLDRVEGELAQERAAHGSVRQQANRMLVTLGALQKENEALRARVLLLEGGSPDSPAPAALPASDTRSGRSHRSARNSRTSRSGRGSGDRKSRGPGFWSRLFGGIPREP